MTLLDRPVAHELSDGAHIHSGHDKSRGKGVPVAMPWVVFDSRGFHCRFKPIPVIAQLFANAIQFRGTLEMI